MKRISTILLISFISVLLFNCKGQKKGNHFSGTIEYAYSYTSDSLNADSITAARPVRGYFRYDENDYQSRFIGKDTLTYYYSGKLNKAVGQTGASKDYECEDYATATDSVISFKLYDTDEKVLGYACTVLELQKRNSFVKYHFSKEIKMSPGTYQKHLAYNWDVYGEKAGGGMVLKLEHRFNKFSMHGTATEIKEHGEGFRALELGDRQIAEICKKPKGL